MSKKTRWADSRTYRIHLRRTRRHASKGGKKDGARLTRAISIAESGGLKGIRVHKRGREWRPGYNSVTLAEWQHKNRKHLRWVQMLGMALTAKTNNDQP